jgi:hypothetical protein
MVGNERRGDGGVDHKEPRDGNDWLAHALKMTSRVGESMRGEILLVLSPARRRGIRISPAPCFLLLQAFVFFDRFDELLFPGWLRSTWPKGARSAVAAGRLRV